MTLVRRPSTSTSRIVSALFSRMSSHAWGVWKALCGVMSVNGDTASGATRVGLPVVEAALAQLEADGLVHRLEQVWAPASYLSARASGRADPH